MSSSTEDSTGHAGPPALLPTTRRISKIESIPREIRLKIFKEVLQGLNSGEEVSVCFYRQIYRDGAYDQPDRGRVFTKHLAVQEGRDGQFYLTSVATQSMGEALNLLLICRAFHDEARIAVGETMRAEFHTAPLPINLLPKHMRLAYLPLIQQVWFSTTLDLHGTFDLSYLPSLKKARLSAAYEDDDFAINLRYEKDTVDDLFQCVMGRDDEFWIEQWMEQTMNCSSTCSDAELCLSRFIRASSAQGVEVELEFVGFRIDLILIEDGRSFEVTLWMSLDFDFKTRAIYRRIFRDIPYCNEPSMAESEARNLVKQELHRQKRGADETHKDWNEILHLALLDDCYWDSAEDDEDNVSDETASRKDDDEA